MALLFLLALPSLAQSLPPSNELIAQESLFWTAYTAGDKATLDKLFTPDFTNVEQDIWNRKSVLDFVGQFHSACTLAPVKLIEPRVSFITHEIATIVYHATETPTCGTHTMSGDTNISTVWIKREGRWQMHLHTEYAIPPK